MTETKQKGKTNKIDQNLKALIVYIAQINMWVLLKGSEGF